MSAYELYLVLHIGAAALWIGAGFAMILLGARIALSNDPARTPAYARDAEWLGLRVMLPCNLVVLVFGFLLVEEAGLGYGTLWILLGLGALAVSFLIGGLVFGPGWTRVERLAVAEGAGSPVVGARMRRLLRVGFLDLGLLLGAVFVMTTKPAASDWGAIAVAAALPVVLGAIGLAVSQAATRRQAEPAAVTLADSAAERR